MKTSVLPEEKAASRPQKRISRRKVLIGAAIAIVVLGLALGVGLGLSIGRDSDDDDDISGQSDPPQTSTPPEMAALPWTPNVNDTWQITLLRPPVFAAGVSSTTPDVTIFDVDLFDTPTETIEVLHGLGKKVICYFSAGSFENWRPDAGSFRAADKGKELDGWPGETWLNISSESVRAIMKSRVELAGEKRCDGVDPDNVDGYDNDNGLGLTTDHSVSLMEYLSSVAHPLNLTLGLKNAGRIIPAVLPFVNFSVNEQCVQYSECEQFQKFIEAGKPVFHIEYPNENDNSDTSLQANLVNKSCGKDREANTEGFSTVLKNMNLDGWVEYCNSEVATTPLKNP
ncbi:glycoside hydrolase superfamily [Boeremia exigua]|uniref:glycoside hydrolase superfamily n=1 Tax=Boeremia exigua TaxID=749465 RepID=UPI001E8CAC75|nr:glycoside hydrolase superfamily [Boeremia exigua]KAH6612973.1 glycoside hydrolase superfamily [Boeremia exigua]